jgi:hypothetical protein
VRRAIAVGHFTPTWIARLYRLGGNARSVALDFDLAVAG